MYVCLPVTRTYMYMYINVCVAVFVHMYMTLSSVHFEFKMAALVHLSFELKMAVFVHHTLMQGLFQDFASEGANTKFQNSSGGKYKAKEGQPDIKRTEKPIPRGGKRIPKGGKSTPWAPPPPPPPEINPAHVYILSSKWQVLYITFSSVHFELKMVLFVYHTLKT